jgi:hypothetical protein
MTRRGEQWEEPTRGGAIIDVAGSDAELASAAGGHPGAAIRFAPDANSDLARAIGVRAGANTVGATEVAVDVLRVQGDRGGSTMGCAVNMCAVNMVVSGVGPDRVRAWSGLRPCVVELDGEPWWNGGATTVVVANGEFLRGADVVPRGHPGDGRLEVQVYALARSARRAMRRRLATGTHLPHPSIRTGQGHRVTLHWQLARPLEIDGIARGGAQVVEVDLAPAGLRLVL